MGFLSAAAEKTQNMKWRRWRWGWIVEGGISRAGDKGVFRANNRLAAQRQADSGRASAKWENRHVGNQADSWATHWQEAPWLFGESHQGMKSNSTQALLELGFLETRTRRVFHRHRAAFRAEMANKWFRFWNVCASILTSATPRPFPLSQSVSFR